jgi:hypothetical protein
LGAEGVDRSTKNHGRRRYSVALKPGALDDFLAVVEVPDTLEEGEETQEAEIEAGTMRVLCPDGVSAGDALFVQTPEGVEITTEVPEGVQPGMEFVVDISRLGTDPTGVAEQTDGDGNAEQQVFSNEQGGSAEEDWLDAASDAGDDPFPPEDDNVLDELAAELGGGGDIHADEDEDADDPFADLVSDDLSLRVRWSWHCTRNCIAPLA